MACYFKDNLQGKTEFQKIFSAKYETKNLVS